MRCGAGCESVWVSMLDIYINIHSWVYESIHLLIIKADRPRSTTQGQPPKANHPRPTKQCRPNKANHPRPTKNKGQPKKADQARPTRQDRPNKADKPRPPKKGRSKQDTVEVLASCAQTDRSCATRTRNINKERVKFIGSTDTGKRKPKRQIN